MGGHGFELADEDHGVQLFDLFEFEHGFRTSGGLEGFGVHLHKSNKFINIKLSIIVFINFFH